jgi:hypothetical protein
MSDREFLHYLRVVSFLKKTGPWNQVNTKVIYAVFMAVVRVSRVAV